MDMSGKVAGYSDDDGGKNGLWEHAYKVDVELMQFTGLRDKSGKEIYEGDILDCKAKDEYPEDTAVKLVKFSADLQFVADADADCFSGLPLTWGGYESLEVIGNVYSNPELLKAGKFECESCGERCGALYGSPEMCADCYEGTCPKCGEEIYMRCPECGLEPEPATEEVRVR